MILTCPNCATRYVVKDGSIGPKGRKVRCASCAHSWHQEADPSMLVEDDPLPPVEETPPPHEADAAPEDIEPPVDQDLEDNASYAPEASEDDLPVAPPPIPDEEPLPDPPEVPTSAWGDTSDDTPVEDAPEVETGPQDSATAALAEPEPHADREPVADEPAFAVDHSYEEAEEEPKRRWPMMALIALLLVAVAAAALVAFGPPDLRERIGLAQAGPEESPFTLMFEQQSIVPLEGTDSQRISVRGRIINSTDSEQLVPIIHARVTDGAGELVESWTIDPPQARLGPGESASFNNARVGEFPEESTLTLAVGNSDG